jgi:argininosuccinate lyase
MSNSSPPAQPLWHGRFGEGPSEELLDFTVSLPYDRRLAADDLAGSRAHVAMLARVGLLSDDERAVIVTALNRVDEELSSGTFEFAPSDEDIHTAIERRVTEIAGATGAKLHTGRSRNDQVALALRLWLRREATAQIEAITTLQEVLVQRANDAGETYLPGYTHLQRAQPVLLAHHLLAHVWALARDVDRWRDCLDRADVSPLGAGALAGSSLPLDPSSVASELGFSGTFVNSLDAVSDRDFVMETLAAASICAVHLSRFAEEIVIWTSPLVGMVKLSDKFTTGSSIMPQKRNPDAAELVRAKTGRIVGALTGILIVMKGLPLAYAKDMQEDKEGSMDALSALSLCIATMIGMVPDLEPDTVRMKKAAGEGYATATDLADWLVRTLKIPFREAHHVTGRIVAAAAEKNVPLHRLELAAMQRIEPRITDDVFSVLLVDRSVKSRVSYGGTAPKNVRAQAKKWLRKLGKEKS